MKCYICDKQLADDEISFNSQHKDFEPCGTCLEIIENVFEPLDEEQIEWLIESELENDEEEIVENIE
jgi:cytidine deaminase